MVRSPRRLIVSFVLVLLLPALVVVWLGLRLIEQDRALEVRQLRERRELACDRMVTALEQTLSDTERRLPGGSPGSLAAADDDAVVVALDRGVMTAYPPGYLLFYPVPPDCPLEPVAEFAAADDLEFRAGDPVRATASLRVLAASANPSIRAGALLRLARNLRKAGRTGDAVAAYDSLALVHGACVSGLPADLVARRARTSLVSHPADARALQADLLAGRWHIDRGTFENYQAELKGWLGSEWQNPQPAEALAQAAEWLWRNHASSPKGRRDLVLAGVHVTVLWQTAGAHVIALLAGPRYQQRAWLAALARQHDVAIVPEGEPPGQALRRTPAETGLPWTLAATSTGELADRETFANRRHLLLAALALVTILVLAGSYFILRAVSREFAVSQLQSDFVAAVSHEFRTPLTSLRQFTELLNDNEELPLEKRRAFYQAQARATDRLHRLVESLLDFGRMEAGKRPYRLERQPAVEIVRDVADEFEREAAAKGFTLERDIPDNAAAVDADRDALGHALWNLLDNAVKYSGESHTVWLAIAPRNGSVAISVRDRGLGIPAGEQSEIFRKFVRGDASRIHGIKGTGIGLAIVKHVVDAHGGSVRVESAAGEGSTFTILLPGKD